MITANHGEGPGKYIKQLEAELQIVRQQLALAQQQLVAHQEHIEAKSPKQTLVQKLDFEYNDFKLDKCPVAWGIVCSNRRFDPPPAVPT